MHGYILITRFIITCIRTHDQLHRFSCSCNLCQADLYAYACRDMQEQATRHEARIQELKCELQETHKQLDDAQEQR